MTSWIGNKIASLYNAVSASVQAAWDAISERLKSVPETASLLHNRMIDNFWHEQVRLKDIIEKGAREKEQKV